MLKHSLYSLLFLFFMAQPGFAKIKVISTYPYIQDLVKQIAKDKVDASVLAKGNWDPHFIVAKPSLIALLRNADLLIINGAQLEVGWLPPLLKRSNNPNIQPGKAGLLELSNFVNLIQKPQQVSRALGDVHPQGNPHFVLDPSNMPKLANAIQRKLCILDKNNCKTYQQNNQKFKQKWTNKLKTWDKQMASIKGRNVLEYHRLHDYFLNRYQLKLISTLEPLAGIPPTPQHLANVLQQAKQEKVILNIRGTYNPKAPSEFVSKKGKIKLATLPHDVHSTPDAKDIFAIFDILVREMTQ